MRGKQTERQTGKQKDRQANRWRQTIKGRGMDRKSMRVRQYCFSSGEIFWLPAGLYLSALIASSAYLSACSKSSSCKTTQQTTLYSLYKSKN